MARVLEIACGRAGSRVPEISLDHSQSKVDPRREASGRGDALVLDEAFPGTSRIAGYIASKSSYDPWWVVAVFPSRRPVWARMNAPVQTDMSRSARFATCRSHSIVAGDSAWAGMTTT